MRRCNVRLAAQPLQLLKRLLGWRVCWQLQRRVGGILLHQQQL